MKAAAVRALGETPRYADLPDPTPRDGMVVGHVEAASLKNLDRGLVAGVHYASSALPLPYVPGVDGVARTDDGTLVFANAMPPWGFMAEKTLIDPAVVVPLPAGIDPVLASAIPNPGLSAWFALEYAARMQPGQSVLILGATGVTGSVAAQLSKSRFAAGQLVVAGRNTDRLEWLRAVCADHVVEIGDDFTEQIAALHDSWAFDVVLDYLWGNPAEQVLDVLGNTGLVADFHRTRYVQIGAMAGPSIALDAAILRSAGVELVGVGLGSIPAEAQARVATELLPTLFAMGAEGTLHLDVQTHALSDVESTWNAPTPAGSRVVFVP